MAPWLGLAIASKIPNPVAAGVVDVVFDLAGEAAGAAGAGIDCLAAPRSPACIVGMASVLLGPFTTSIASIARHLPDYVLIATTVARAGDTFVAADGWIEQADRWWRGY